MQGQMAYILIKRSVTKNPNPSGGKEEVRIGNGEASDGLTTAVYNKVIAASAPKNTEDVILETKDYHFQQI